MSLLETLASKLGGDFIGRVSRELNTDEATASTAVNTGMASILGGLARNASKPEGARSLLSALTRDHDGGVLDDVSGLVGGSRQAEGEGILGHVFGKQKQVVEASVGQAAGLDQKSSNKLMAMLAPAVMGALGKQQREQGLDANALAGFLGQQREEVKKQIPQGSSLLGKLFDQDGDGDFDLGDVAKAGLGKLFGR
jgi:hypothetical protein